MSQDASPFAGTTPVASLGGAGGGVTLVAGQTFCVSAETGDIVTDLPHGLFVLDTRVLSDWELRVNGHTIEPLAVDVTEPFSAIFVGHARPAAGRADADIVLFRCRSIGSGMREQVAITNHGLSEAPVVLELMCGVDFADLFEVKESRVRERGEHGHEVSEERLRYTHRDGAHTKAVTLIAHDAASIEPGHITWRSVLGHGQTWEICVELTVAIDDRDLEARFHCGGADEEALPVRRMQSWRATLPGVETDHPRLASAVQRSGEDLGALRIFDPDHPDVPILAAGAPWFMTVFGRDSLLTAWMTLIADSSLAEGVLRTLGRFQGSKVEAATEEEPGKILHEMRFGSGGSLSRGGSNTYYGSIDATPLFVMLLGELGRWDPDSEAVSELLPHADRALEWIEHFGDRDGDGYVEYQRQSDDGLVNQGWKDSWDAVRHLDGELATGPIALCEVQGYVYGAYLARAHLALATGDVATFARYRDRAVTLRRRFNEDFWLEERGWYALGLDGDKRPIEALASNIGHCLWTGIVDPDRADAVVAHLMSEEMFSGWGIRTLATSMTAYNPVSYHNGSVWPHDNALCIAGLARYGYLDDAHRVIDGQLAAADAHDGRLPELFAGFHRERPRIPAAYPTSCSPQAWAAAAPLLWLRAMLRLDPWAPGGEVALEPALPSWLHRLHVDGITVAGQHLTVEVERDQVSVAGEGRLRLVRRARPPQWQPDAPTSTR